MNNSLRAKLAVAFGVIFFVLVVATASNFYYVSQVSAIQHRVIDIRLQTVSAGKDINNGINASEAALRGYMILGRNPEKAAIMMQQRRAAWDDIERSIAMIDKMAANWTLAKNIEVLAALKAVLNELKVAQQQVEDIVKLPANVPPFQLLLTEVFPRANDALNYLLQMQRSQNQLLAIDVAALNNASSIQVTILAAGGMASLLMSVVMALWFSKDLLGRLVPILQKAQDIANNNLSSPPLKVRGQDELATLTEAVNQVSQSLNDTLCSTAESMMGVSVEANNIYCANSDMSSDIALQVEQMSLIASAIEELSASAAEVLNHSVEAADSAESSLKIAEQGGQLVESSLSQMTAISDAFNDSAGSIESLSLQSQQIEDILGVIRGIAEQTNLLALNAAIEAARAGEQGRGFAVVADEVRQLASRTTEATADVEKAIESMRNDTKVAVQSMGIGREKVFQGIEISDRVAKILTQIIERAKEVATKVETIATTSKQQSIVTEEIAGNTDQVSTVSLKVSEGITSVVAMAQAVTESSSTRADELQKMLHR